MKRRAVPSTASGRTPQPAPPSRSAGRRSALCTQPSRSSEDRRASPTSPAGAPAPAARGPRRPLETGQDRQQPRSAARAVTSRTAWT